MDFGIANHLVLITCLGDMGQSETVVHYRPKTRLINPTPMQ